MPGESNSRRTLHESTPQLRQSRRRRLRRHGRPGRIPPAVWAGEVAVAAVPAAGIADQRRHQRLEPPLDRRPDRARRLQACQGRKLRWRRRQLGAVSKATDRGRFAHTLWVQYTLRDIPLYLDSELRRRAKVEGKTLNAVALEALMRGAGMGEIAARHRDLGDVAGTWQEDRAYDDAIADQDRVDTHLWR